MVQIINRPFNCKITIQKNDLSLLTYDPTAGGNPPTSGTYDFRLVDGVVRAPYDSTGGQFSITIVSSDATNSAMNTLLGTIRENNEVSISVGKTAAGLIKIFLGKIETIAIKEPNKNLMYVTISGPDWGSDTLKNLVVNHSWVQKKSVADQNIQDATDKKTTIGQLVYDLLSIPSIYPDLLYPVTAVDLGVILTTGNYPDVSTTTQIPQFEANMEKIDDKIAELDELGGYSHFIDANKIFYMKPSTSISISDVLLTDDVNDAEINGTVDYNGKVGYIAPGSTYTSTVENHKGRLYGVGSNTFSKDQSQEIVTGTTNIALSTNWYAQRFTPIKQDCYQIGVYIGYTGTPSRDLTMILAEDNGNLPTGSTLRTLAVNYTFLTPTGAWHYFPIDQKLTINNKYWVILTGGTTYTWYNDNVNAGTSTSAVSTDGGVSWGLTVNPNKFSYSFIHFSNDPLVIPYPTGITSATKHLHDEVITRLDIKDSEFLRSYIRGIYLRLGKRKIILNCKVYAPDKLLSPNQYLRVRKQLSGKVEDDFFVLGQVEYVFASSEELGTGTIYVDVEAVRFADFP